MQQPTAQPLPLLVSLKEAASMLGIDYLTVRNLIKRNELKYVQIGDQKKINRNYLLELAGEPRVEVTA
jgi:excisionase family DNA binding protein